MFFRMEDEGFGDNDVDSVMEHNYPPSDNEYYEILFSLQIIANNGLLMGESSKLDNFNICALE